MGLFEDLSRFLESRLEEFLRNNPHLELQALEEQLREQEQDSLRIINDLQGQEKKLEGEILATAQEVKRWHLRVEKAQAANRMDLAKPAQEREAALLRQGNQLWGHMKGVKERIKQAQELLAKIQQRRQEVRAKAAQMETNRAASASTSSRSQTEGWNKGYNTTSFKGADPLDDQFKRWEAEDELDQLKRNMGR
ncbi:MAG TPA: TIGR04376 family protein [Leptolyngbyaceae cyanobacterium]